MGGYTRVGAGMWAAAHEKPQRLAARQRGSGFWPQLLDRPASYFENPASSTEPKSLICSSSARMALTTAPCRL
jgi:hypothetical protein